MEVEEGKARSAFISSNRVNVCVLCVPSQNFKVVKKGFGDIVCDSFVNFGAKDVKKGSFVYVYALSPFRERGQINTKGDKKGRRHTFVKDVPRKSCSFE